MANRTHRTRTLGVVGAVLLLAAVAVFVVFAGTQKSAPQPSPSAASAVDVIPPTTSESPSTTLMKPAVTSTPAATTAPAATIAPAATTAPTAPTAPAAKPVTRGETLPRSAPTHITVPAIGVSSDLPTIGLNDKQEIQTPPLDRDSSAYWLDVSPTPGQLGPSTIIGHVDSAKYGPAVFFKLGALKQRDTISVTRADGIVAEFQVEKTVEYPKAEFPTQAVYGNLDHAGLRLITCGGLFDPAQHNYESNIVVFASLVSTHKA